MKRRGEIFGGAGRSAFVVWALALVTGVASSCTSLPDIQPGTCGNGVLEPERGEDCDSQALNDAGHPLCYAAGTSAQCHFDCSTTTCPATFSCGSDNVCRKPKGIFKKTGEAAPFAADRLLTGDFNQDRFGDVVAQTAVDMSVLFGDSTSSLTQPFIIRQPASNPAVGQLALDPSGATSESTTDLVFSASLGLTTWRGRSDRTLAPTPYPSLALPGVTPPRVMTMHVIDVPDDVFLLVGKNGIFQVPDGSVVSDIVGSSPSPNELFADIPNHIPSDLAGDPVIAQFDERPASPCKEFALAFAGDSSVAVYTTCRDPQTRNTFPATELVTHNHTASGYQAPEIVKLPTGVTVRSSTDAFGSLPVGVRAGDVNGDGHLDLLIDATTSASVGDSGRTQEAVGYVAFGVGDGTFTSSPTLASIDHAGLVLANGYVVLAADELTTLTDISTDLVFPEAIVLKTPKTPGLDSGVGDLATSILPDQLWTDAKVIDIDGDGFKDIIAAGAQRIDVYKGSGTVLTTHVPFSVEGIASSLAFGDYDGDGALDIAFRASHPNPSKPDQRTTDLDVMWGRFHGTPEDPDVVAQFSGDIVSLTSGTVAGALGNDDAVSDLGVVIVDPTGNSSIAVLAGATSRQLEAAFFIQEPRADQLAHTGLPLAYATGQFNAEDRHVDLVSAAAIARNTLLPNSTLTDPTVDLELVVASVSGAAVLDPKALKFSGSFDVFNELSQAAQLPDGVKAVLPSADWSRLSMAAVDLDGPSPNGVDEIVGLAPAFGAAGRFFTAKFDGTSWVVSPLALLGDLPSNHDVPVAQVLAADLNGDGASDVLVLSDNGNSTNLVAVINDRSGKLPTKSAAISLPSYASGATETQFHIVSMAAIDADTDAGKEVALLTDAGGLFFAKSNPAGDAFTVTGPFCDGDVLASCVNRPNARIPSGQAVAAVDVDGDGVQDLVIASGGSLQVYKGLAVDP